MYNGVCFCSKCYKDYVDIATVDEKVLLKLEWITIKKYKNKQQEDEEMKKLKSHC